MDTRPAPTAHGARSAAGSFWIWLCTMCPARGADWIPPAPRLEDATEKWPFSAARAAARCSLYRSKDSDESNQKHDKTCYPSLSSLIFGRAMHEGDTFCRANSAGSTEFGGPFIEYR
jgi:hypothetical protein